MGEDERIIELNMEKKIDFHMGCCARRETISFGFSLQIRVFLKAQKNKRIYGALINVAK